MEYTFLGLVFKNWHVVGFDFFTFAVFVSFFIAHNFHDKIVKTFFPKPIRTARSKRMVWLISFPIILAITTIGGILEKYTMEKYTIGLLIFYAIGASIYNTLALLLLFKFDSKLKNKFFRLLFIGFIFKLNNKDNKDN